MKKNILRIIIISIVIILVLLFIFGIGLIKKHFIIQGIRDNLSKYKSSNNYYVKMVHKDKESEIKTEIYKKENNYLERIEIINNNNLSQTCDMYSVNGEIHKYIVAGDNRIAVLENNNENVHSDLFWDMFDISNKWDYIMMLRNVKISNVNYKNKECYFINLDKCIKYMDETVGGFLLEEGESLEDYTFEIYVEKDTGLILMNTINNQEYEYEFNKVTDEDFIEPDISEYEIKEN